MTTVHLLHAGYNEGEHTGSSVTLVRDGDAIIVMDPGMVAHRSKILDPLREHGVAPEAVTHVVLSHHHPDHTMNVALFEHAEVIDYWARYVGDLWLDNDGDGHLVGPRSRMLLTPGHSAEDVTLVVEADDAVYAMTHLWWYPDRTPVIDPYAEDLVALEANRARILDIADIVIPAHGSPFRVRD